MKLTKAKLIKTLQPKLESLGYIYFKDSIEVSQGLFIKKINSELYLSLGLVIDRYYDSSFTGSFYLSNNTSFASVWGDIPKECYERPTQFLSNEERLLFSKEENNSIIDLWFDGFDESSINDFIKILELSEIRFVNQQNLIENLNKSIEVKLLSELSKSVIEKIESNYNFNITSYNHLPNKEIDNIPLKWFQAAEISLKQFNYKYININTVISLAADAFRQNILNHSAQ